LATGEGGSVGHADDKKVKALHGAVKAIREDRAAFKRDPKGKVSDLDDDAVAVFKGMSESEYDSFLQVDEKMEKAGFTIASGNFSVRMV
jgi:mitochondrial fission protein ELM1